ncbi:MAG: nucleotide exchange factor GrpE [Proteobacteria bacterium]|nr:nucleotide exchange factor GrpE [Pseudomonadota bacterium]MBU4469057.1 nucleotide exchange factor GrpE [Pseudomonadota bacterium]MCG2751029.1 nucleotide exchange factor GrpE [Desulfobacteraceae bacterium]
MKDKESTRIKIKTDNDSEEDIFADSEAAYGLENQAGSTDEKADSSPQKGLIAELETAREEAKLSFEKYLRIAAEFDNYKKRSAKETEDFRKYANEVLLKALLPVVDNLERAIKSVKEEGCDIQALLVGVELTLSELVKVFHQSQVKIIDALGESFDPNFHQAMMQQLSDEHPDNTVLQELQKGYTLHSRLLRPAMVIVSKTTDK